MNYSFTLLFSLFALISCLSCTSNIGFKRNVDSENISFTEKKIKVVDSTTTDTKGPASVSSCLDASLPTLSTASMDQVIIALNSCFSQKPSEQTERDLQWWLLHENLLNRFSLQLYTNLTPFTCSKWSEEAKLTLLKMNRILARFLGLCTDKLMSIINGEPSRNVFQEEILDPRIKSPTWHVNLESYLTSLEKHATRAVIKDYLVDQNMALGMIVFDKLQKKIAHGLGENPVYDPEYKDRAFQVLQVIYSRYGERLGITQCKWAMQRILSFPIVDMIYEKRHMLVEDEQSLFEEPIWMFLFEPGCSPGVVERVADTLDAKTTIPREAFLRALFSNNKFESIAKRLLAFDDGNMFFPNAFAKEQVKEAMIKHFRVSEGSSSLIDQLVALLIALKYHCIECDVKHKTELSTISKSFLAKLTNCSQDEHSKKDFKISVSSIGSFFDMNTALDIIKNYFAIHKESIKAEAIRSTWVNESEFKTAWDYLFAG